MILLHEIYGLNDDILNKARHFSRLDCDVYCPNLLSNDIVYNYEEELEAYRNFVDNIGFDQAYDVVKGLYTELKEIYDEIYIVGYSVGATVTWMMSEVIESGKVVCFYGSRIRDYTHFLPKCQVAAFFAMKEQFNVRELMRCLEQKENIYSLEGYNAKHGFANPDNSNYDKILADKVWKRTVEFLEFSDS